MQLIFKLQDGGSIPLTTGLPRGYRGFILKGAETAFFQNSSATIIMQNYQRPDFAIKISVYKFLHIAKSILEPPAFPTGAILCLKQELNGSITGSEQLNIEAEHFTFIQYGGQELFAEFKEGKEYRILDISCSHSVLTETLSYFPKLTKLFQKAVQKPITSVITPPRFAGFQVLGLINDLLHSPYQRVVNEIYFQYKVRECLFHFLVENAKKKVPEVLYTEYERNQILNLKLRLEQDPVGKYPIADVARELGMNTMRLKILFKKIVGCGIFEFHKDQRMNEALQLLKNPDLTAKMVAGMVGYDRVTSFISEFTKHQGFAPGKIQERE